MSEESIGGLPNRPLTDKEVRALDQHAAIDTCWPVYYRNAESDEAIMILILREEQAHPLIYNPEQRHWERVGSINVPESITDEMGFDPDVLDENLLAYYDEDELEPVGFPNDPLRGLTDKFPEEPLSEALLADVRRQPMVANVIPMIRLDDDDRIVTLILIFEDLMERQRIVAGVGYDRGNGRWQVFGTVEGTNPDREAALEDFERTFAAWVQAHYSVDELTFNETPEEVLQQ